MHRRSFIASLIATALPAEDRLAPFFEGVHGTAVLIDVPARRPIAIHAPELAGRLLAPPGSTMKPLAIAALLESGKLRPGDSFRCGGVLEIGGRGLNCSHPIDLGPIQARGAIAYSCNCFVANYAERFERGELPRTLTRYGLASRTGWIEDEAAGAITPAVPALQALGEDGVMITPAGLAMAYYRLAITAARVSMATVVGGLEDAVEYGTAQRARVEGLKVAGKTGSVRTVEGAHLAWFAGFAPSSAPKLAIAVMLQGRSGGADAAPIAGKILEAVWRHQL